MDPILHPEEQQPDALIPLEVRLEAALSQVSQLREQLALTDRRYRSLIEQSPVAMFVFCGQDLRIDVANDAMHEMLSKKESMTGKTLLEAVPELRGQPALDTFYQVLQTGQPAYGREIPVSLVRNGEQLTGYFNFSYLPLVEDGQVVGIIDTAVEVTDQVRSRKVVEKAEQQLAQAIRYSGIGTWSAELRTGVLQLTDEARKIHGFHSDARPTLQESMQLIQEPYREIVSHAIQQAISNRTSFEIEYAIDPHDGSSPRWLRSTGYPGLDSGGIPETVSGTILDMTEQKRVSQQKDDFISIASHELRTPVTVLKSALQLLENTVEQQDPAMTRALVLQANRSMSKVTALIDNLLNATRMTEGQIPVNKTSFVVADMLNDCCDHIRISGKYNLLFEGNRHARVFADEEQIEQVVVNFVNNAVKYAPESPDIVLRVDVEGSQVKVSVTDQGEGIARERIPLLFERFYRGDHTSRHYSGLGLGLYISAETIRRHDGEIGVDSVPGNGSTFWFTLPLLAD